MPTISFTSGNDSYTVTAAGIYELHFLAGNDTLTVDGGTDTTAFLGAGADVASILSGDALVYGELGNDRFELYANDVQADGGADHDLFNIRHGSGQNLFGGAGNDRFNFATAVSGVTIHAGDGNDDFAGYGWAISGTLYGGAGDDLFTGFGQGLVLYGGLGNDTYRLGPNSYSGLVEIAANGVDVVQLMRGADYTLPANIENLVVGSYEGSDTSPAAITGNDLANAITGHGNAELMNGLGGDDRLSGKAADDSLHGGDGNDYLDGGAANDFLSGNSGNDILVGRTGNDTMNGGAGNDTYYVDTDLDSINEALTSGYDKIYSSITLTLGLWDNVEAGLLMGTANLNIYGNDLDNHLTGNGGNNLLYGAGGNDYVLGGGGHDQSWGGDGNDILVGGDGYDTLYGEEGNDHLSGGAGNDVLQGYGGDDSMGGGPGHDTYGVDSLGDDIFEEAGAGADTVKTWITLTLPDNVEHGIVMPTGDFDLTGNDLNNHLTGNGGDNKLDGRVGNDTIEGGAGNDLILGFSGNDVLHGGDGTDLIFGDPGNDIMFGDAGADDLYGSGGDDQIIGGSGNDLLRGSIGADSLTGGLDGDVFEYAFVVESPVGDADSILDFQAVTDQIDLASIDANSGVVGDQAFTLVTSFSGTAGQLRHVFVVNASGGGDLTLLGDVNGDSIADFELHVHTLEQYFYYPDITL
jgi:Ca2+-binding RTX toxin-like protein